MAVPRFWQPARKGAGARGRRWARRSSSSFYPIDRSSTPTLVSTLTLPRNVCSHGVASNSGGAAIAKHFCLDRIRELSEKMTPNVPTGLHYYPLAGRGERFPHNNPDMEEQLEPRPESDILFLQALMEGVTSVEKLGYDCL